MDDVDPTLLILLAVAALLILKPDLLSGLLGGRPALAATPAAPQALGPNVTLYPPPAGTSSRGGNVTPWMDSGDYEQAKANARDSAYAAAHPCPGGQFWNSLSFQCTPLVDLSVPGQHWYGAPPPGEAPQQRSTPSAPAAVAEIKASDRRARLFTPWSGS